MPLALDLCLRKFRPGIVCTGTWLVHGIESESHKLKYIDTVYRYIDIDLDVDVDAQVKVRCCVVEVEY